MATAELEVIPATSTGVVRYSVADAQIAAWREEFMPLHVSGINDAQALARVHDSRMTVKAARVAIEKERKALKADALAWGNKVDHEARRLTQLIEPIEDHLQVEEDRIESAKAKLKAEAAERARAVTQARVDAFFAIGALMPFAEAEAMTDEKFKARLEDHRVASTRRKEEAAAAEAERQRLQTEADARNKVLADKLAADRAALEKLLEEERLKAAAEQAEQARQRAELEKQQAALAAERQRLGDEEAARQREIALQREREEAAERARVEAEARVKREKEEAERVKAEEEAERVRVESLRPARQKIDGFAHALELWAADEAKALPDDPPWVRDEVRQVVESAAGQIRAIILEL